MNIVARMPVVRLGRVAWTSARSVQCALRGHARESLAGMFRRLRAVSVAPQPPSALGMDVRVTLRLPRPVGRVVNVVLFFWPRPVMGSDHAWDVSRARFLPVALVSLDLRLQ